MGKEREKKIKYLFVKCLVRVICVKRSDRILKITFDEIIIRNAKTKTTDDSPRDRKFSELVIIFLGGIPPRAITFRQSGTYHLARWLRCVVHSLELLIFL